MPDDTISAEQMRRAVAVVERRMAINWLAMIVNVRAGFTIAGLTDLINRGDFSSAIASTAAGMGNWFTTQWLPAYTESASSSALFLQRGLGIPMSFDVTNFSAIQNLSTTRLRLVRGFTAEQTEASLQAIQRSFVTGANPRATARAFRDSIGLTARQEQAVANYEASLRSGSGDALGRQLRDRRFDPTVRRAIRDGEALSETQVRRMTGRYRERMLKYRSEVIARTEGLRSVNGGQKDMFDQAVMEGNLQNDQLERMWNTAADNRVRDPAHTLMHGQTVTGVNTPFVSGKGNELEYPGDPAAPAEETVQCRCAVSTTLTKIVVPA